MRVCQEYACMLGCWFVGWSVQETNYWQCCICSTKKDWPKTRIDRGTKTRNTWSVWLVWCRWHWNNWH